MQDNASSVVPASKRIPWNKGKLTSAEPPLRQAFIGKIIDQSIRRSRQTLGTANFTGVCH
jgi:hypothetical protein